MRKNIEWTAAVIVLVAYALMWAAHWAISYIGGVPGWVGKAVEITRTVALCLMYVIVLFSAFRWTENWILRIIFIGLAGFLIASALAGYIPAVENFFVGNGIPLMR